MREPDFGALTKRLIRSGISPRHAHRTASELRDHYDDLVDEAVDSGVRSKQARRIATAQLGSIDDFVTQMAARRELKTWAFRYPRLAVVVYPVACFVALPAMPVIAGFTHRDSLMRWGASLFAAGMVTAALMLVMQLTILLS